jgi:threonine/homoserine/homoserine lactone efflux protein
MRGMTQYAAFLAVAAAALLVPGPDTLMVLKTSLTDGRRSGLWVAAGSAAGNVVWGVASVAGVAAVLAASSTAFSVMKLAGALYLAYLGVNALRAARRGDPLVRDGEAQTLESGKAFRRGLVTDLANVKVGLFWTALVPQFLTSLDMSAVMVASMGLMVFAWLALYATAAARMRSALTRTRPARAVNATTGAMFVGLAAKLARAEA